MQHSQNQEKMLSLLTGLYGDAAGREAFEILRTRLEQYHPEHPANGNGYAAASLSERDAILITYGDQVREPGVAPLRTLSDFCSSHLSGLVSGIHILPFYPYSSDDGFSVIDYRAVDPELGSWDDIDRLGSDFRLMFDAVINHVSVQSGWFRGFLRRRSALSEITSSSSTGDRDSGSEPGRPAARSAAAHTFPDRHQASNRCGRHSAPTRSI